jgi:hypothetical protein
LLPNIWENAQKEAKNKELRTGVIFGEPTLASRNARYRATIQGDQIRSFAIIPGRDKLKAKTLAIAVRLEAEALERVAPRNDANIIAQFPEEVWEMALGAAQKGEERKGVRRFNNAFIAALMIDGKQVMRCSFSITPHRDEVMAKALAIASREMAVMNKEIKSPDQATIEAFEPSVWTKAQQVAQNLFDLNQHTRTQYLPRGVTYEPPRPDYVNGKYKVLVGSNIYRGFGPKEGRSQLEALSLAIATRMTAVAAAGDIDAATIAGFTPEVWAQAQKDADAEDDKLPECVTYHPLKVDKPAAYKVRIKGDEKRARSVQFSITDKRSKVRAKALAIAKLLEAQSK